MSRYILLGLVLVFGCEKSPIDTSILEVESRYDTKKVSVERICAEMQTEYETGGSQGVSEWLGDKVYQGGWSGKEVYSLNSVIACAIEVGRSGK